MDAVSRVRPADLARLMDEAEPDVLAFMTLHSDHRTNIHSFNLLIGAPIRRRSAR